MLRTGIADHLHISLCSLKPKKKLERKIIEIKKQKLLIAKRLEITSSEDSDVHDISLSASYL